METAILINILGVMGVGVLGQAKMMEWDRMVNRVVKTGKAIQMAMGLQVDKTVIQTTGIPINSNNSSSNSNSGVEDQTTRLDRNHHRDLVLA